MKGNWLLGALLLPPLIYAQSDEQVPFSTTLENQLENQEIQENTISDQLDHLEPLENLKIHPLNLNKATRLELERLIFLSDFQINQIMGHRIKYGAIQDLEEMQLIPGFDDQNILELKPYLHFGSNTQIRQQNDFDAKMNHRLTVTGHQVLEKSKGFTQNGANAFQGDPLAFWLKYRLQYHQKIGFGLAIKKQAGEVYLVPNEPLDMRLTGFFSLKDWGILKYLIIGDYHARFGQGLTFQTNNGFGKSADVLSINRGQSIIRPNTSVSQSTFQRGFALGIQLKSLHLHGFFSHKPIDAILLEQGGQTYISSINSTGLYRNPNELSKKNKAFNQRGGLQIEYQSAILNVGILGVFQNLSHALLPKNDPQYTFENARKSQENVGLYFSKNVRNTSFFGELTQNIMGGRAWILGLQTMPTNKLGIAILCRSFGMNYHPIQSAAFGEKSVNSNEKGLYLGLQYFFNHRLKASFYMDHFYFPWLTYGTNAPNNGQEYLAQLTYQKRKSLEFLMRYKFKKKLIESAHNDHFAKLMPMVSQKLRIQLLVHLNAFFRLRSRVEGSLIRSDAFSTGFMAFQELKYKKPQSKWSCLLRYTLFETDDYNARIYAFEQDLSGLYSIPSYAGKGSAFFILFNYKWCKWLSTGIKYGIRWYDDRKSIGSGLDEINGTKKSEVKMQAALKF